MINTTNSLSRFHDLTKAVLGRNKKDFIRTIKGGEDFFSEKIRGRRLSVRPIFPKTRPRFHRSLIFESSSFVRL